MLRALLEGSDLFAVPFLADLGNFLLEAYAIEAGCGVQHRAASVTAPSETSPLSPRVFVKSFLSGKQQGTSSWRLPACRVLLYLLLPEVPLHCAKRPALSVLRGAEHHLMVSEHFPGGGEQGCCLERKASAMLKFFLAPIRVFPLYFEDIFLLFAGILLIKYICNEGQTWFL